LIKYFAVLASFTAAQTWVSQSLMDISIQAIIRASQSDIILDNGSMINLIKDMRERLSAEQLSDWRQKWVTETYHFLHTSDWRMRTQSHQLSWIDFVLFADVALAPIESEKYYHWLLSAPHSAHSHFIPSIQFGIQIMKLLSENKNKRTTWIRILSIILEFYAQYQYISQSQVQLSVHENISKFVSIMESNQIEIYGSKKISSDIMDMIIRKHPRALDHAPMDSIDLLTSLSSDVMQFLETKSSKLTSLHIRMPQYSVCCASTAKLSRFNNIQKLSLGIPSLSNSDFTSIINQMGPQLTHLELQGAEELRKCFSVISSCKKMKKLNLAQTQITYSELLDVTDSCQELEELNISECWALNEDRLVLAELFQDGLQQLRVLDASGLQVQKDFQFMANQGYYMPNVRELTINNTLVDPHHILRVFPNLEVLESAHGPDMKDTVVAEATFDYNSTNSLKSVNIASKGFSNFCKYLDCLSFSYGLEKLNLSNCPWITRNNMIMRLPTSIKELDISNCGIDQTHVMQICQRLKNLERLNISRNGGMNGRRVIELLANCPRLTSIDVSFCFAVDIQEVVGSRTARDILANKVGFELHIDGCSWTKESVVAFSIIYPTVQLLAGNHIYVEAAKEFLARINIPNIAM
jgi:Leucine-rich repeat (LRR) protein